ncbi:NDMA-dependent alcohol dehydrogenase [Gordonia sp. LSe1-13]|uniref:alcohol dehydrogenase n=1 Tax=Gordonia sesuvii TaxID=3116777 RepID=A0ABU7M926_9ACTN|nr:NDMA-dependent alcohol dehydrogenase [Gordonia sp. LSe1-13]
MRTRGAVIRQAGQPWSIEEIEIGEPRKGEVLVQLEASGLCHSDHHVVAGDVPDARFPILGGHEGAGVVIGVGAGVEDFAIGDHVVMSFIPSCGKCRSCQSGNRNLCDVEANLLGGRAIADGQFRVQASGEGVHPMSLLGTFAPYAVVHQTSVVKIDPSIPFEIACLVGCGVTTGYGAAVHTADIRPGDDVAVIGAGAVGSAALQGALLSGARRVFVIDPDEWKREQAQKFGATETFSTLEAAASAISELTAGRMCKTVLVTVSRCDGREVESWLQLTAKNGTCVVAGMGSVTASEATLNLSLLSMTQKNLRGSVFGGGNPHLDIPETLALYKLGDLRIDDMVTREYRLDQINEGYHDMVEGRNLRGVIRFTDADR